MLAMRRVSELISGRLDAFASRLAPTVDSGSWPNRRHKKTAVGETHAVLIEAFNCSLRW